MQRASEIVVIDSKRRFGNGYLMPMGPLRELPKRLQQVDLIINNGGHALTLTDDAAKQVEMTLAPGALVHLKSNGEMDHDSFQQKHIQVNALAGIGDPQRFLIHYKH